MRWQACIAGLFAALLCGGMTATSPRSASMAAESWPAPHAPAQGLQAPEALDFTSEEKVIAREDLDAQQQMAVAAEQMTIWTKYQVAIAAGGTLLVGASLVFSALATRAGFRAAKAAEDALISQERPRFMLSSVKLGALGRELTPADNGSTEIEVKHKNFGKGTAWIIEHVWDIEVAEVNAVPAFLLPAPEKLLWPVVSGSWWGFELAVGEGVIISIEDRSAVHLGTRTLYLYGRLKYRDLRHNIYELGYAYTYRRSDGRLIPFDHEYWRET